MDKNEPLIKELLKVAPAAGQLEWIGIRPAAGSTVKSVESVAVSLESGLEGDHYRGRPGSDRQVTLIQAEHLDAVGGYLGEDSIRPERVRRNLLVKGINLYPLRRERFRIGDVILEGTGLCHPCSQMERELGKGGYYAMRGHGGITARVIEGGTIRIGDPIEIAVDKSEADQE